MIIKSLNFHSLITLKRTRFLRVPGRQLSLVSLGAIVFTGSDEPRISSNCYWCPVVRLVVAHFVRVAFKKPRPGQLTPTLEVLLRREREPGIQAYREWQAKGQETAPPWLCTWIRAEFACRVRLRDIRFERKAYAPKEMRAEWNLLKQSIILSRRRRNEKWLTSGTSFFSSSPLDSCNFYFNSNGLANCWISRGNHWLISIALFTLIIYEKLV
jgi:hypothetical protein